MKEFYGKWKFSKKRQSWIWKWKKRKVSTRAVSMSDLVIPEYDPVPEDEQ